jgi:hypothetical protein
MAKSHFTDREGETQRCENLEMLRVGPALGGNGVGGGKRRRVEGGCLRIAGHHHAWPSIRINCHPPSGQALNTRVVTASASTSSAVQIGLSSLASLHPLLPLPLRCGSFSHCHATSLLRWCPLQGGLTMEPAFIQTCPPSP